MGRAALGAAAKDKTGSVRVTVDQFRYFMVKYGGLGRWLQARVNEEIQRAKEAGDL